MTASVSRARGASASLLKAVLCAYVLAVALMPLGHHDIACHLKSSTHCTTCVVGAAADVASDTASLVGCGLQDAGTTVRIELPFVQDVLAGASSGRAPPSF